MGWRGVRLDTRPLIDKLTVPLIRRTIAGGLICHAAQPSSAGQPDVRSVCRARALECIAADVPIVLERPVAPTMIEAESVVPAAEAAIAAAQEAK